MVFYRKYRSQTIDELDSQAVRETLLSVLSKQDTVPHAFLFTGPKGLGKTSAARIIAKAVNCERLASSKLASRKKNKELNVVSHTQKVIDIEPCNECEQCRSITNGTNMDILEIDAASNRGIDEIRDLREKIRLSPISAAKKVYIIDEVHMLTTEAFNALLKTLEEPPAHAMFILCTTEPHKIPATILSRCFHIQFKLATADEIVRSLKRIVEGEKLQADTDALYMIAKMAEGGFRDGAKILEELSLLAKGEKITKELVDGTYKVLSTKHQILSIFDALLGKDIKMGLQIVDSLTKHGVDMKYFLQQMMEFLHEKLLEQAGIGEKIKDSHFAQTSPKLRPASKAPRDKQEFTIQEIKILFELLSRVYAEMKTAVLPQLPLEIAIIEYGMSVVQGEGGEPSFAKATDGEVTVAALRKQAGTITKIKALYGSTSAKKNISDENLGEKSEISVELLQVNAGGEVTPEWVAAFWKSIISEMKQYNHTIAGVLRGCSIKDYKKNRLVIETGFKFHKDRLDAPKVLEALRNTCKMLTGKDVEIEVKLRKT